MSTLGEDLKSKEFFDDASTSAPTPMERSTTNSLHSSKEDLEKVELEGKMDGEALAKVESSMYPGPFKLIPIFIAIILSIFLVALDMTSKSSSSAKINSID